MLLDLLAPKPCLCVANGLECVEHTNTPAQRAFRDAVRGTWSMSGKRRNGILPEMEARVIELFRSGYTDQDICAKLGLRKHQTLYIRRKNGVARGSMTSRKMLKLADRAQALYEQGMVDREISEALKDSGIDISSSAIHKWRQREGLKPNAGNQSARRGRISLLDAHADLIRNLHGQKLKDRDIVRELRRRGIATSVPSVCNWRLRHGLRANRKQRGDDAKY